MAKDKKGFLLYADHINVISKLPDEQAGKLIKIIYAYVNDQDPVVDDLLLQIAFEPIKQQLKRDLKRYEAIVIKRSEAGKASAEKKKQNSTLVESVATKSTLVESVEQTATKSTDSENENDTVNDTVNDNVTDTVRLSPKKKWSEPDFNFDFIDDRFRVPFFDWMKFRREIDEPILHQAVLEKGYKQLVSLSKNNSETAAEIVLQSMNKGWKHLYELKDQEKSSGKKEVYDKSQRQDLEW